MIELLTGTILLSIAFAYISLLVDGLVTLHRLIVRTATICAITLSMSFGSSLFIYGALKILGGVLI